MSTSEPSSPNIHETEYAFPRNRLSEFMTGKVTLLHCTGRRLPPLDLNCPMTHERLLTYTWHSRWIQISFGHSCLRILFSHHLLTPTHVWYVLIGRLICRPLWRPSISSEMPFLLRIKTVTHWKKNTPSPHSTEMAKDHFTDKTEYELMAGYYSPVSDAYKKEGLAPAIHRVNMCQLGVDSTSDWLMVDSWESRQSTYTRTAVVLDHFNHELNVVGGGMKMRNGRLLGTWVGKTSTSPSLTWDTGERRDIKIMLLAGGDLIASFGHPGVWAPEDVRQSISFNSFVKSFLVWPHFEFLTLIYYFYYFSLPWLCHLSAQSYTWYLRMCHNRKNWHRCVWLSALTWYSVLTSSKSCHSCHFITSLPSCELNDVYRWT